VTRQRTFTPQIGLPGRVWARRGPVWIPDVLHEDNFPRGPYAAKLGLHCAFGFPLRLGDEVLGVMEFFSPEIRPPDEALLAMMAGIGGQIGQFIVRTRAADERARLLARVQEQMETHV